MSVVLEFTRALVTRLMNDGWKPVTACSAVKQQPWVLSEYDERRRRDDEFMASYTGAEDAIFYGEALALQFGVMRKIQECEVLLAMAELRDTTCTESE